MPSRHTQRILSHVGDRRYEPRTAEALMHELSIADEQRDSFRTALDELLSNNQIVRGRGDTIGLPPPGKFVEGLFRKHPDGFGFLIPDQLIEHGDLFVPPGATLDALTGDRVRARVVHEKRRGKEPGKSPFVANIIEVLTRAERKYAGTLEKRGSRWQVAVDGRMMTAPILVRDVGSKNAKAGDKVVVEILAYPDAAEGTAAEGVIVEVLGAAGEPDVETLAVMHAFGLADAFPPQVLAEARAAAGTITKDVPADREDLTGVFIATIDPPDAKDFDDAISIEKLDGGRDDAAAWELGVHIADVAHFVTPGSALDTEAYARANSTYLPRRVIPMLPEVLSNGVCSLQPDVRRYAKSCFIRYDRKGRPLSARFARSVINSRKRLTYLEAQALIDDDLREARRHCRTDSGGEPKYPRELIQKLKLMDELARTIRQRRLGEGMIVLGLPEVSLIFDDSGRVVDAEPEDNAFTHTIIEMFMVEANEAAARLFDRLDVPMIRRTHPEPDAHDVSALRQFARVAGYNVPARPSRKELQQLLDAVRGKPAQQAVHFAVLRTMNRAEYSPNLIGHFALASEHYTHFTSPIRRYPDLIVHRGIDAYLRAALDHPRNTKALARAVAEDGRVPDFTRLVEVGRHCSTAERNSSDAERELRNYLVLELLSEHLGDDYAGTVTGVAGQGLFIQLDKFLVDGFVKISELPALPADRWRHNRTSGHLVAERSGKTIGIGDRFTVRVASVDLARRKMDLALVTPGQPTPKTGGKGAGKASGKGGGQVGGKSPPASNKQKPRNQAPPPAGTKDADPPRGKKKKQRGRGTPPAGPAPRPPKKGSGPDTGKSVSKKRRKRR